MKRSFERGRLSAPGSIPLLAMDSRENMPLVGRTRPWTLICALTRDVGGPDTPARGWKADAGHTTQMTRTPATNGAARAPLVTISVQPEEIPLKCKRVLRLASFVKGQTCWQIMQQRACWLVQPLPYSLCCADLWLNQRRVYPWSSASQLWVVDGEGSSW